MALIAEAVVDLRKLGAWLLSPVQQAVAAWQTFWFAPGDPLTLGVLRWLSGAMLIYTHLIWGLELQAFFGSTGWNSPDMLRYLQPGLVLPSFWWSIPESWMIVAHWTCGAVLLCYWLGLWTEITAPLALAITISYSHRATLANYGLDQLNAMLTMYLAIGGCRALSVWDLLDRRRPLPQPSARAGLGLKLIQFHYCVIYFFAATSKLLGEAWWTGEATWMALANLEYQSLDLTWTAHYPRVLELITHATVFWELSFPFLIWNPRWRPWLLAMGTLVHLGIGAFLGMWTFGLIMIFGYAAFLPATGLRHLFATAPAPAEETSTDATPAATPDRPRPKPVMPAGDRPRLLFIDRDFASRGQLTNYFSGKGYAAHWHADLAYATKVVIDSPIDFLVIFGRQYTEDDLHNFHLAWKEAESRTRILFVLTQPQADRLGPYLQTPTSAVAVAPLTLREIRETLEQLQRAAVNVDQEGDFDGPTEAPDWR